VRDRLGKAAASVLFLGSPASHTYGDRALALRASFELAARARDQGGQCLLVLDSVNRALESLARRNGMAGLFSTVPLAIDELGAACQHARDLEAGGSLTVLLLTETPLGRTPRRDPLFRALGVLPGRGEFNPVLSRSMRLEGTWPPIDFAASVPLGWGSYVFRPHLGGYGFKLLAYYAHYQAQVLNRGGSACLDYPLPANGDEWYERLSALVAQDSTKGIALGKQVALFAAFHYGELGDVPVHLLEELERALHERLNDTPEFVERLTLGCAGDKRNELAREVRAVVAALLEP